jgi:hypothetical protein
MRLLVVAAIVAAATAGITPALAAGETPATNATELELQDLVQELQSVLPESWRIVETGTGGVPIGWTGPATGLYVMFEDTGTRFFHPNGFHYYSFYRIWIMPAAWEGEMRRTSYISDSAPAFLLGLNEDVLGFYHTAGGNVWSEGPEAVCGLLDLNAIRYNDLMRRVVDMEIETRLTEGVEKDDEFAMNPHRIVGLAGEGQGLYLEYVFPSDDDDDILTTLTERVALNVFERFPEVESLYLRRCTSDTFTDTILNRD